MQIILLEKVVNLGQLGEVVKVRDGYARNFLIPQGKARRATKDAIAEFEARRAELERLQAERFATAEAAAARINGITVDITEKAGVDGRLFGSVTNFNIADALKAKGHAVDRSMIRMPEGPIKSVGTYAVGVSLHADVDAEVNVNVIGETV
ncbi:MAG: 50S ribosomal protein L9 [Burkholderiaceae bacterium]